jgi:hypothetical protein
MYADDLTEMRIRNFILFAKLVAKYDLWDDIERHLETQGMTNFVISSEPLKAIASRLEQRISAGTLPPNSHILMSCGCIGGGVSGGDGGKKDPPKVPFGPMAPGGTWTPGGGNQPPDGGTDGGTDGGA